MMSLSSVQRKFCRDESGIAATEMGLILVPFSVLLLGAFDLGYQNYVRTVMQGTLTEIARDASTESPVFTGTGNTIERRIKEKIIERIHVIAPTAVIEDDDISIENYYEFSGVGKPEKLTTDQNANGQYDEDDGDCWEDVNGNDTFDLNAGRTGLGGASDIVFYQVNVVMPRILPMASLIGVSHNYNITTKTAFRTQPFGVQTAPQIVCAET